MYESIENLIHQRIETKVNNNCTMLRKRVTEHIIAILRKFPIELFGTWLSTEKIFQIFQKEVLIFQNKIKAIASVHSHAKIYLTQ